MDIPELDTLRWLVVTRHTPFKSTASKKLQTYAGDLWQHVDDKLRNPFVGSISTVSNHAAGPQGHCTRRQCNSEDECAYEVSLAFWLLTAKEITLSDAALRVLAHELEHVRQYKTHKSLANTCSMPQAEVLNRLTFRDLYTFELQAEDRAQRLLSQQRATTSRLLRSRIAMTKHLRAAVAAVLSIVARPKICKPVLLVLALLFVSLLVVVVVFPPSFESLSSSGFAIIGALLFSLHVLQAVLRWRAYCIFIKE
jgi:hypothetical protein